MGPNWIIFNTYWCVLNIGLLNGLLGLCGMGWITKKMMGLITSVLTFAAG